MSKIFGTNSEIGDWMMSPFTNGDAEKTASVKEAVTEESLVSAREQIEKCAESGETFQFGSDTPEDIKKGLMEYAEVVGLPGEKMEQVDSEAIRTSKQVVEAVAPEPETEAQEAPQPIFDIMPSIATDPGAFEDDGSWESVKSAKNLGYQPDQQGIIPVRGGETYEANPVKGVRDGENSIANPDAIDTLSSTEDESSLDVIRQQNEKRRSESTFDVESWESEVLASQQGRTIIPDEGYRMVESPQSQNHTSSGDYRESMIADPESPEAPDLTMGEKISEINDKRASDISREVEEDDWEKAESSVGNKVSDLFYKNLEEKLKDIE